MTERYESGRKPRKCPKCGSHRIARILYGYPACSEKLEADMKSGRIALGGCCITFDDPAWKCIECETEIYR
jgi:ribosomal protein L37AE/L43A